MKIKAWSITIYPFFPICSCISYLLHNPGCEPRCLLYIDQYQIPVQSERERIGFLQGAAFTQQSENFL